jgi:hypothetical protein
VEIDGEHDWHGGHVGNPTITPLVRECDSQDTILVQINPIVRDAVPTTARDIVNRLNEVAFNSPLVKELRMIALLNRVADPGHGEGAKWIAMRIDRIATDRVTVLARPRSWPPNGASCAGCATKATVLPGSSSKRLAPMAALVAAAFSGEPLLAHWTQTFMGSAAGFFAQFFPLFLLDAPFGKILDDSGSVSATANFMTDKLGPGRSVLAVVLAGALVTYGGVSCSLPCS